MISGWARSAVIWGRAEDAAKNGRGLNVRILSERPDVTVDLAGKLTRRDDNQYAWPGFAGGK